MNWSHPSRLLAGLIFVAVCSLDVTQEALGVGEGLFNDGKPRLSLRRTLEPGPASRHGKRGGVYVDRPVRFRPALALKI